MEEEERALTEQEAEDIEWERRWKRRIQRKYAKTRYSPENRKKIIELAVKGISPREISSILGLNHQNVKVFLIESKDRVHAAFTRKEKALGRS